MEGPPPFIPRGISVDASPEPNELPRISMGKRPGKPTSRFLHNLMNCFSFFKFKKRKTQHLGPKASIIEHKLRTASVSTLSLSRMEPKIDALPYKWPADGTVNPKNTALVIIDMQIDFCAPEGYLVHQGYDITPVRAIIPRLQHLLSVFRSHGFPIYHTREGHRPDLSTLSQRELQRSRNNESGLGIGDLGPLGRLLVRGEPGHEIIPELYPLPSENVIDKPGRSAFQHTDFGLLLKLKGVKNLILCGVTTDVCVHSTMREANDNGFDCLIVEDATAASEASLHEGAIGSVKAEGGIFGAVTTSDKILGAVGLPVVAGDVSVN